MRLISILMIVGWLSACNSENQAALVGSDLADGMHLQIGLGNTFNLHLSEQQFSQLEGQEISVRSLAGQYVLVNYWATWCAPCIRELPSLIAAAGILDGDIKVLLVSDERPERIRAFMEEQGFDDQHVAVLQGSFADNGIYAVPSTTLYNDQAELVGNWIGSFEWDSPQLQETLRAKIRR